MVACREGRLGLGLALATSFVPGFKRINPMANTAQDADRDHKRIKKAMVGSGACMHSMRLPWTKKALIEPCNEQ